MRNIIDLFFFPSPFSREKGDRLRWMRVSSVIISVVFISCSDTTVITDTDVVTDRDIVVDVDADLDVPDFDRDLLDKDNMSDFDSIDEKPDADSITCLDLRFNENTIKTAFPFEDKNGKITFCRPGCDTPTETDPQCVRNIWEWDNWSEYQVYLEAQKKDPNQKWERECYPWPCKLPDMKAYTDPSYYHKCDRSLAVHGFDANMGIIWSHGMSDGIAGMGMTHSLRTIEYDPEKDEYMTLGQMDTLSFNENRYVLRVYDRDPEFPRSFIVSILRKNGKYYYELIYDNKNHNSWLSRPSFAGRKWVLIQVREGKQSSVTEFKYASSEDWEWHNLEGINNYTGEGNIIGDHLTFITNNREIYYCDLRKYPKHINDCKLINRKMEIDDYELGHSPRIDLENEKRLVYNVYRQNIFMEVDLIDINNPIYKRYEVPKNKDGDYAWEIDSLKGDKLVYSNYYSTEGEGVNTIGCFYRFDKGKIYCPQDDVKGEIMGFNVFWGKWHLWKDIGAPTAMMRDWECYCEETGVCPLEE